MKKSVCMIISGILIVGMSYLVHSQEMEQVCNIQNEYKIEGIYNIEEVITFFEEVVLDTEYFTGEGDYTVVQKWKNPLYYSVNGTPTEKDMEVLEDLCEGLNRIKGFPGIYPETEENYANIYLNFWNYDEFYENMGEFINYEDADGAVQYWYDDVEKYIWNMTVGYRTEIDQTVRNSVILEEIINGLGITDTWLREDSIVYGGYSETQNLSDMDWLILELLYHPDIECGMNAITCEEVIRKIYSEVEEVEKGKEIEETAVA